VWELDLSGDPTQNVRIYLRHSAVDTGLRYPPLTGAADPFVPGGIANWWESIDIVVDSEPYRLPSPEEVDFVAFEESRRAEPQTAHGQTHVFVQVHQRGPVPAANLTVRLFWASAAGGDIPDLPSGFWDQAASNQLPAGSAWNVAGQSVALTGLQVGGPKIAAFQWTVPATAPADALQTTELNVSALVQNEAKCAIKRVACET
jgi:hypothetical protein